MHLDEFLTEFPPLISQILHAPALNMNGMKYFEDAQDCYSILECDMSVREVGWARPGYTGGIQALQDFIDDETRLAVFSKTRNDPNGNSQSHLAPWLHFGQISVQRCILEVSKYEEVFPSGVGLWRDFSITWRELSDNFCYYNPDYDNIRAAPAWALATLRKHQRDKREKLYSLKELDDADTYDSLWNSCQLQMRLDGWMHGYMRMYWAKKILEWTESPEQALEFSVYLNDRYSLDGRDPNGYLGIQWSITGLYDGPFDERPVHGTVRGMTSSGRRRKFDVDLYVSRFLKRKVELGG